MRTLAVIAVALTACAADPTGSEPVARKTPSIDAVTTRDGFTEVCEGCTAMLVITGDGLATTDSVVLSSIAQFEQFEATVVHTSNHEVRALLVLRHGATNGLFDVTVSGHHGTATAPNAIRVTPVVASPSASPAGHGTFQSPMRLCHAAVDQAGAFDTLLLLAGTHTCDHVMHFAADVAVVGEGVDVTRVTGTGAGLGFDFPVADGSGTPFVSDLTIDGAIAGFSITEDGGNLVVSNVRDHGGIHVTHGNQISIDHYAFDGPGRAIVVDANPTLRISNTTIDNCSEGIAADVTRDAGPSRSVPEISTTTISHCGVAMRFGTSPQPTDTDHVLEPFVDGVQLVANTRGIVIENGSAIVTNSTIDAASGILVENGSLSLSFTTLTGVSAVGLDVETAASGGRGTIHLETVSITGGQIGLRIRGFDRNTFVGLDLTTIRDQTVAGIQLAGAELFDAPGLAGRDPISVISGSALDDERTTIPPFADLFLVSAMTLNGHAYTGQQLHGPLTIGTDLHITSPQARWQF